MVNLLTGALVVLGACIALGLHHHRQSTLISQSQNAREKRFAVEQYARRSLTTSLIGLIGLALMGIEASRLLWLDALVLLMLSLLVPAIPLMAYLDYRASRKYFRENDEGVRHATRSLIDELKKIEADSAARKAAKSNETSHETPAETRDPSAPEQRPTDPTL